MAGSKKNLSQQSENVHQQPDITGGFISPRTTSGLTSLSLVTIWRLIKRQQFPKPYQLSPGRVGFLRSDIDGWLRDRLTAGE